jgi:hypothetical protein
MAKTRLEFQSFLEALKGDRNVYFQPPSTVLMKYPAIRYNLDSLNDLPADNIDYQQYTAYRLIYITSNPDDVMIKTLSKLPYSRFVQWYAVDNLNHYVYTIFY